MARALNKLSAVEVRTLGPGRHSDGGGLYLDVDAVGRRRWIFMWRRDGRRREMGLGGAGDGGVKLADARKLAQQARDDLAHGRDPIEARDARKAEPVAVPTFGDVAEEFVKSQSQQFRNEKHRQQWAMTLKVYAHPLRELPVDNIKTADVLECLKPLWSKRPETASRLRGRIERVLDAAKAKGHRSGENPAAWRGHLDHLLPRRQKLTRGHHAALPYGEMPAFIAKLREREGLAALALEFAILTAARSGEVRGATWTEIDLKQKVWTVPATRMKAAREHRVPLSARAVQILETVKPLANPEAPGGGHLFPGPKVGKPLSENALSALLKRMGRHDITAHGFRSSFRDWSWELTSFPREIAEAALAHVVGDATERAYRRGDALEKRRKLMDAWAAYCTPRHAGSNITPLARRRTG